jgi:sarcosine oxidase subunit beta
MQTWVERQRALDVPTRLLTPAEVHELLPQLVVDDLTGATFCPTDGSTDPGAMVRALAGAAQARGVQIQERTPVTAIQVKRGKVQGVVTPHETIAAPVVINATGVAAALVARLAGVKDLPVWPLKRQVYQTEAFEDLPQEMPTVVDLGTGFHFRRRDNGIMLVLPAPVSAEQLQRNRRLEAEAFTLNIEESLWPLLQAEMKRRCPTLVSATIRRVWAGLYEMTPDEHPILGETGIKGFYNGCGFSGRGFIYAPRAARLLAEALLDDKSHARELKLFSQERFKKGKLLPTVPLF